MNEETIRDYFDDDRVKINIQFGGESSDEGSETIHYGNEIIDTFR